ncbi:MAG: ComF family protein [Candidatus Eisenbacteria bacterium]|nr:ComF family protein [Candidatus Eisenbacteria bacterium]
MCPACLAALADDGARFCLRCGGAQEGRPRHLLQAACARAAHEDFRARCLFWMRAPMPALIHQFKYRGVTRLAETWGPALGQLLTGGLAVDLVLPVPLHPAAEARRGYNQAALLARLAAREAGLPCIEDALARARRTPTQTRLDPLERRRNLAGAFEARRPELLRGRRVALVDDVVTTGATLSAAVEALKSAGAEKVRCVGVARA